MDRSNSVNSPALQLDTTTQNNNNALGNKEVSKSDWSRKVSKAGESIRTFFTGRKHNKANQSPDFSKWSIKSVEAQNRLPKGKSDYRPLADAAPGVYAHFPADQQAPFITDPVLPDIAPSQPPVPDITGDGPWQPDIVTSGYSDPELATTELAESGGEIDSAREIANSPTDSLNAPSADVDVGNLLNPVSVGVDIGTSAVSHSVTLGFKLHKLSKLHHRKEAFKNCPEIVSHWKDKSVGKGETVSFDELKDFSRMAVLSGDASNNKQSDAIRNLLSENKSRYASGAQVFQMTTTLLNVVKGVDSGMEKRLNDWRSEYRERNAHMRRLSNQKDNKELIKYAHQSKKMMNKLNSILKPLGARMNFATPFRKGKSAMASRHKLVIDEKKLYQFLDSRNKLPSRTEVQDYILSFEKSADVLKAFSGYEGRKFRHQKSQAKWTAAALGASFIPVLKIYYGIRAGREFKERHYRKTNNIILNQKLNKIKGFETENSGLIDRNTELGNALKLTEKVIKAKQKRTDIKTVHATVQGGLDVGGALAGTAASIAAPGVGSLATDVAVGVAKASTTIGSIVARKRVDKQTGLSGRIESQAYLALKHAYRDSAEGSNDRHAIHNLTQQLFDISPGQTDLLFKQDDKYDIVSAKSLVRLRFNNFKHGQGK